MKPKILSQDIGDTAVQYLWYDQCDGPVIIFLHATGFLPWLWHPIANALSGSYRILAPYFCDHRVAEPEEGGLSWMVLAEDLCSLCRKLRLDRPFLVGHSMGATVMTLGRALHQLPVAKMVLIEPIFLPGEFYRANLKVEDHPLASKSIRRKNQWTDAGEARAYLKSRKLFMNWDEEMLDLYIRYGMVEGETGGLQLTCSPRREAALFMGSVLNDPWPLLHKVDCPVLVLEGGESENRAFIDLKKAAAGFPKGRYMLVEGAGHLIPMEMPSRVTEIIREFFSGPDT
jgi:pimeloyl-ACP methyl ester carboxylesterase